MTKSRSKTLAALRVDRKPAAKIIDGLTEAAAIARGEAEPAPCRFGNDHAACSRNSGPYACAACIADGGAARVGFSPPGQGVADDADAVAGLALVTTPIRLELLIANTIKRHRGKGSANIDTARAIIGQMAVAGYAIISLAIGKVSNSD